MKIRHKLSGWLTLAVFATVGGAMVAADPAFAKVDVDKLTIGGEARIRYEIREGANFLSNPEWKSNVSNASSRIRVSVGYDLTPDVSFFAQLQDARNWGNEGNPAGNMPVHTSQNPGEGTAGIATVSSANQGGTGVDLHQGYILVKNAGAQGLSLKLGRQEIIFGDHRLFGNFGWSQVGNSFDAVRATYATSMADLDLFWARIADSGTCGSGFAGSCNAPVNGGTSNLGVVFPANVVGQSSTLTQDIYGAYLTLKPVANWTVEPYYFLLADGRASNTFDPNAGFNTLSIVTPQAPTQNRNTVGTRINGKAGGLDFTAEAAHQFGAIASPANRTGAINDRDLHINAHAEAVKIGYTMAAVPMKPRIGFEFDYASGDNCVNKGGAGQAGCNPTSSAGTGGHLNTFDNLYPTNHFHYGYMDLMAWRNMVNYQFMFDVKPSDVSKFQINFILHRLARVQDNWYRAAQAPFGVTTAGNQHASLGQEIDFHYWHTFKEKFKFEIGYGHFFTGEIFEKSGNFTAINGCRLSGVTTSPFNSGCSGGAITAASINDGSAFRDQDWGYVMASILF